MYTVIFRYDGIVRNYPCETPGDYMVLIDALQRRYGDRAQVEAWLADTRLV